MMNYVKETGSRDLPLDQGLTSGIRFSSMSPVIGEAARFQTMRSDLLSGITSRLSVTRPESRCRQGIRFNFIYRGLARIRRRYYLEATRVREVP